MKILTEKENKRKEALGELPRWYLIIVTTVLTFGICYLPIRHHYTRQSLDYNKYYELQTLVESRDVIYRVHLKETIERIEAINTQFKVDVLNMIVDEGMIKNIDLWKITMDNLVRIQK